MKQVRQGSIENDFLRGNRKASQGFLNIKSQTTEQLLELIERQNKLLQNKSFLEKLPDKGQKISSFKTELEVELKRKQECDAACKLLFNLSLSDKNSEEIEWNNGKLTSSDKQLDSDDDDDDDFESDSRERKADPLKFLATHSGTINGEKKIFDSLEGESSVKDLNVADGISYVEKFCKKYEKSNEVSSKERFKPNRFRNNDKTVFVTSAEKVKKRLGDKWEVTEATPPAPVYNDAVMISLSESLKLQKEQAEKLKEIEKKNATDKLLQVMSVKIGDKLPVHNVTEYRNIKNVFDNGSEDYEENEIRDSDEDEEIEDYIGQKEIKS